MKKTKFDHRQAMISSLSFDVEMVGSDVITMSMDYFQESILTYNFWIFKSNPQFTEARGLGKIGTTGFLLGIVGGIHFGGVATALLCQQTTSTCLVSLESHLNPLKF